MVKISVIVPVYNAERYLEKCLDSICGQTLKETEIICVNDGSTDNSLKILENYARKDDRIKVLSQKNQYAGAARNNGMKYAAGKYLSFLDADDYFEPDMLEKMFQRAEEKRADVVICRSLRYDVKAKQTIVPDYSFADSFFYDKEVFSGEDLKFAGVFQITNGWAWDKLFRADFVRQCGYEFSSFRSSEDGFFAYMLTARAKRISYMDNVMVMHRINESNSLSNTKEGNWRNGFKMLLLIKEELIRQGIYDIYEQSFLNRVTSLLEWYLNSMNSFEAFKNCYIYMQTEMEPQMGVLKHNKEYYFQEEFYDWYQKVVSFSLDEYLYLENEKNIGLLHRQNETISRQQEIIREKSWVFPYHLLKKGKVVILYGAGEVGQAYYSQLVGSQFCKEVIWVDKQYDKYVDYRGIVQAPEIITQREFDYIFIAVKQKEAQEEIGTQLLQWGISTECIRYFG